MKTSVFSTVTDNVVSFQLHHKFSSPSKSLLRLPPSAMEFLTALSPLSHSMPHNFAVQNVIFLMQKRLQVSTTQTHVSVSSRYPPLPSTSFTVEYLVNSCGLPLKSAISASRFVHLKEKNSQRHDAVLDFLKSCGLDDSEIARVVERTPKLISAYNLEEILKPKVEFLIENGFYGPRLRELIVKNPCILTRSLTGYIKPTIEFLKSMLGTEERVWLAVKRNDRLLTNNLSASLQPKIDLLVKEGVAIEDISDYLVAHPHRMQPRMDRLVSAIQTAREQLGIDPSDLMFLHAVMTMSSFGVSLWGKKMEVFKSFGFSQDDFLCIFRRFPNCLSRSEETLRTKLDFYLNTVELTRDDMISYPPLLSRSIDSTSRPRHNVLKVLQSKKLLKKNAKLAYLFTISEEKFFNKYVLSHLQHVPDLLEMYNNDIITE